MKSLRILMFTTFYPPYSFGGDAVGVQRMACALVARGHQVTVVHDEDAFLSLGGQQPQGSTEDDGVTSIGLRSRNGMLSILLTQQVGRPVVHGRRIREIIDAGKFDIIWHNNTSLVGGPGLLGVGNGLQIYEAHEHWLVCPTHVLWRYNKELCNKRECIRCAINHKRPPQLWRYTGYLDRQMDQIDLVIAKSEFSRDKHREFGLRQDMVVLPYFLPDLQLPAETNSPHQRPYFLFVGRLEKIKGLQDIFPAFDKYPDADLLILGDGDYSAELKALAAGNDRIKFLGRKPLDELNTYYRSALGLIVPSVCYETFGIILIEAFRLGTPVIARRLGPFPEIVEKANGGVLFEDEEGLIAALRALQIDPKLRDKQSKAARLAFEKYWSETPVLAGFGAAFAKAAFSKGDNDLAHALEAGAFEHGPGI